jgi:hypothetical protein
MQQRSACSYECFRKCCMAAHPSAGLNGHVDIVKDVQVHERLIDSIQAGTNLINVAFLAQLLELVPDHRTPCPLQPLQACWQFTLHGVTVQHATLLTGTLPRRRAHPNEDFPHLQLLRTAGRVQRFQLVDIVLNCCIKCGNIRIGHAGTTSSSV